MTKKTLQQVIKQYEDLGIHSSVIQIAYKNVNGDDTKIIDEVFRLQNESSSHPVNPGNVQDEQAQLNKAIELSMNDAKDKKINLEPLNPQQRVRKPGVPVGLKNIGNTCYFNSLLQTYFQNANFVRQILKYEIPQKYSTLSKEQLQKQSQQNFQFKRKLASCRLVQNLKNLFAQMIASDRKYVDPTPVLTSIVDDYGNQLPIGDQKDIGQFNLIFLSRVDEGLGELHASRKMEIQGQENLFKDSPSKLKVIGGGENQNLPELSHSLLKNSSIKLTQSSIVSQQFIGKMSTSFHNENLNFHKEEEQLFSLLFVNVKNKELYQALEQVVISHIDDYRNQKGQVVGVEKRTWIQEAPKTLFFQIDRVVFDKQKGTLQKINDIFDFPKQFYIDPFLNKNKDQALQIQKTVRSLREKRQRYIENLNQLQNYGKDKKSLLQTILTTAEFLDSQSNKMQIEEGPYTIEEPMSFPSCQKNINSGLIQVLKRYATEIDKKENEYRKRIDNIQEQIEKCYESIRTQPYVLNSILIHEGSAEMGHYYSYVYDIETNTWRKYNDINISEESSEQVFKEAKGNNVTSAYYLVYVLKDVLSPLGSQSAVRNYSMSNDQNYMKDYYSSFLNPKMKEKIISENHQMYSEIQQYKMGSFATRVVDSYAKKFEICNETFRKNKPQKKKNCPPLLISLPLFLKFNDQNDYKNALIDNCIQQYGPKQYNPAFEELVEKKMSNFNEFKRPKNFKGNEKQMQQLSAFMQNVYNAIASKHIFKAIKESSYSKIFSLLAQLQSQSQGSYFNWLSNLLSKTIVVQLMIQAQREIQKEPEESIKKLKMMVGLLFRFINLQQQKVLYNNCIIWLAQMALSYKSVQHKNECQRIAEMVGSKRYKQQFSQQFINKQSQVNINKQDQNVMEQIRGSVEVMEAAWNLSRTEDVLINEMLSAREQVKQVIEGANELYREMKKYTLSLKKQERDKIILRRRG